MASTQEAPILTLQGKQYAKDSLSDQAKEAVAMLQAAERQLLLAQDQVKVLTASRQTLLGLPQAELEGVQASLRSKAECCCACPLPCPR